MRITVSRASLVLLCVALVIMTASHAYAISFTGLNFPSLELGSPVLGNATIDYASLGHDYTDRATAVRPFGGNTYIDQGINMMPKDNQTAYSQITSLLGIPNSYQVHNNLPLPQATEPQHSSWMDSMVMPAIQNPIADNSARSSYDALIGRFSNQSNIYQY